MSLMARKRRKNNVKKSKFLSPYGQWSLMVLGILTYGQDTGGLKDVQLGPPPKENAPIIYKYKESAPGKDLI